VSAKQLLEKISQITQAADEKLEAIQSPKDCEQVRLEYLGKKGSLTLVLKSLKDLTGEDRKEIGKAANVLKEKIDHTLKEKRNQKEVPSSQDFFDHTLPGIKVPLGKTHPITKTINDISAIFKEMGFAIVEGREVETERYNFEVLNVPPDHPARDDFDTFYTEDGHLLRSQTSTVQGRIMEQFDPPLAIIAPGKVYRPDTVDASHSFMFHQMEGFWVDQNIRFSDLKGILYEFSRSYFGPKTELRFRPHCFPFTEPSVEIDMLWGDRGWIEILGAGQIDPAVFEAVGYPKGKYSGFAFGLGIERICMLKYGIDDIRYFYENDLNFLKQF